jgi:hypothetical protein
MAGGAAALGLCRPHHGAGTEPGYCGSDSFCLIPDGQTAVVFEITVQ